jgi:hypothetical protein
MKSIELSEIMRMNMILDFICLNIFMNILGINIRIPV